jgi:prepilin-type N-terminal cleavage/methylation domain-containing protein
MPSLSLLTFLSPIPSSILRTVLATTKQNLNGFTLIELLLVIGILGILTSIVILSVNPRRQLSLARDSQRRTDVTTILNAIYQYSIDNDGAFPSTLSNTPSSGNGPVLNICKGTYANNGGRCTIIAAPNTANTGGVVSLRSLSGRYVAAIPTDPYWTTLTSTGFTGYKVQRLSNGRLQVTASGEIVGIITVSK